MTSDLQHEFTVEGKLWTLKYRDSVPPLVFSTFLTSLGVEDISKLSEDDAQVVLAWIANGDGQVAA